MVPKQSEESMYSVVQLAQPRDLSASRTVRIIVLLTMSLVGSKPPSFHEIRRQRKQKKAVRGDEPWPEMGKLARY